MKKKTYLSIIILLAILFLLFFLNQKVLAGEEVEHILINEILFDPIGTDLGNEWIELYNPTNEDISVNNWKILVAGSSFVENATFFGIIEANSYFLICENNVSNCNVNLSKIGMQNGGGATDALSIVDENNEIVDQIFYDIPNSNLLRNNLGSVVLDSMCADISVSGETLGRKTFLDTDNSFADFFTFSNPSPGEENITTISEDEIAQTGQSPLTLLPFFIISFFSGILLHNLKLYISRKWQK